MEKLRDGLERLRDGAFARLAGMVKDDTAELAEHSGDHTKDEMLAVLRKQQVVIDRIATDPKPRATVLSIEPPTAERPKGKAVVAYQGTQLELAYTADLELKPGDEVNLLNSTLQIVEVVGAPNVIGEAVTVTRVIEEGFAEVNFRGSKKIVLTGAARGTLKAGDQAVVDPAGMIILRNLGRSGNEFEFTGVVKLGWDDIIGCVTAKEKLRDMIEALHTRPDIFEHYGDAPSKGGLLAGKPGCGKTLLLMASIGAYRKLHGDKGLVLYVKGAELLRGIVGETEELIKQLFALGRAHLRQTGIRALLLIDEAEAVLKKRGSGKSSDVEMTNVATFLAETGGPDSADNPTLLLASNRPDLLDDGITRDERLDEVVTIQAPTRVEAPDYFRLYLKRTPLAGELDEIAEFAAEEFFSPKYSLAKITLQSSGEEKHFTLGHIVNGAMLAGVARRAKANARKRDEKTTKQGDPLGKVTKDDVVAGIEDALQKNKALNHQAALLEFLKGYKGDIVPDEEILRSVMQ